MTLHILKLCVGCDSVEDLRQWQQETLAKKRKNGEKPVLIHWTRMTPKRRDEVLDGGSLYWVIKGYVRVRHLSAENRRAKFCSRNAAVTWSTKARVLAGSNFWLAK